MQSVNNDIDSKTQLALNNQLELLCFKLRPQGTIFAINVFKVRETVKYQDLTQLPDTHEAIVGLLTLRTQILPVVDMATWLYNGVIPLSVEQDIQAIPKKNRQIIICEFNNVTIGVDVFKAEYILRKNWDEIMVPITQEFGNKVNNYTKNDGEIVYIIDIEQMLTDIFPEIAEEIENDLDALESMKLDISKEIIIAEDSVVAQKAMDRILKKLGVRFQIFPNGQELLNYVHRVKEHHNIALIITDLEMPIASGFTVIREIKEDATTANIPVVVNSSMSGNSNVELAKNLNADGFIPKTSPTEVAEIVKKYLAM